MHSPSAFSPRGFLSPMSRLVLTIHGLDKTQSALTALKRALGDKKTILRQIGEALVASTDERFVSMQSPDGAPWKPLHPRTIRQKRNKQKILTERGLLRGSIHYELNGDTLEVGTDRKYGAIHQFGGVVKIPARTQTVKIGTKGKNKGRFMKAKSKAAHAIERTFIIPAHDVTIPARPFLGLSSDDKEEIVEIVHKHLWAALKQS